jgi:hypothetical protein
MALIRNLLVSVAVVAQFGASAGTALVTAAEDASSPTSLISKTGWRTMGKGSNILQILQSSHCKDPILAAALGDLKIGVSISAISRRSWPL